MRVECIKLAIHSAVADGAGGGGVPRLYRGAYKNLRVELAQSKYKFEI